MEDKGKKPAQPWTPDQRTVQVGERDPITGYVPVDTLENDSGYSSFLTDVFEDWEREKKPEEYAAGFRARMAAIPDSDSAHPSWRSGWNNADTELLEQACHGSRLEEGKEDDYPGTRALLYDAGHLARENGVLFDPARTEPWKQGWITADIEIGAEPEF